MTYIFELYSGARQSGSTTILLGALERFVADEIPALYIAPTQEMAHWVRKMRRPKVTVLSWGEAVRNPHPGWRVVGIDDTHLIRQRVSADEYVEGMSAIKNKLSLHPGPTQLILVP